MILIISRAPSTSGSNWICAFLVARATEAPRIPLVVVSLDSMLWTHDAHVIPVICMKIGGNTQLFRGILGILSNI